MKVDKQIAAEDQVIALAGQSVRRSQIPLQEADAALELVADDPSVLVNLGQIKALALVYAAHGALGIDASLSDAESSFRNVYRVDVEALGRDPGCDQCRRE